MTDTVKGYVHSFQSFGAVDGPGIRYVVFLQGCPLRCGCCHNPDTWEVKKGNEFTPKQVVDKVLKYKTYFGETGGITLSGGEPILQPVFCKEVFNLCKKQGINTCLDTSGYSLSDQVKDLLEVTDRVLLDVKYTDEISYKKHVGCEYQNVLEFLEYLNEKNIPTTLRQVIIPTLNDTADNAYRLKRLKEKHACIDKIELLPFKKVCQVKYDQLKIDFPFKNIPTPDQEIMQKLNDILLK